MSKTTNVIINKLEAGKAIQFDICSTNICCECNTTLPLEDHKHGICIACQEKLIMEHYRDESYELSELELAHMGINC